MEKRRGGPVPNSRKEQVIRELTQLALSGEIKNKSLLEIQEIFPDITRQTLSIYLKEIYKEVYNEHIDEGEINIYLLSIRYAYSTIFDEIKPLFKSLDEDISPTKRKNILNLALKLTKSYTDYLEKTGILPVYRERMIKENQTSFFKDVSKL